MDKSNIKKIYSFLVFYSFVLLFFCSGSSPFIHFMSTDSSVFFTMGRGMVGGKVVYLDLFDHKGWYIYFFNYLGALISSDNSVGIYLVEGVFVSIDAILCYKIYYSYICSRKSVIATLVTLMLFLNYFTYQGGNLVEVYALTFQLLSFYYIVKYIKTNQIKHNPFFMLIHGICVGVVLFLRANMIMMWGSIALIIIIYLFINKKYTNLLINIAAGFAGIIIGVAPPVVYSVFTGSTYEMIDQCFVFNVLYVSGGSLINNLFSSFHNITFNLVLLSGAVSVLLACISKRIHILMKLLLASGFVLSSISVTFSPIKFEHYLEIIIPFFIPIIALMINKLDLNHIRRKRFLFVLVVCGIFILSVCVNLRTPIKLFVTNNDSKEYIKTIDEISNEFLIEGNGTESVLVTNNNSAFYNAMKVIPKTKYFYTPLVDYHKYPYAIDEQVKSIVSGDNDVLIINYSDYQNGIIYSDIADNEKILNSIKQNYYLKDEVNQFQMWIKKKEG